MSAEFKSKGKGRPGNQIKTVSNSLSRGEFLRAALAGAGGLALSGLPLSGLPLDGLALPPPAGFPEAERLGRVFSGKVSLRAKPDEDSAEVGVLFEDAVVAWLREMPGLPRNRLNQRWVETPDGYLWAPYLQPVRNQPNPPVKSLPKTAAGPEGMWVEVSVPYVDLAMNNPPPRAPSLKYRAGLGLAPRLYYNQVMWADRIKSGEGGQTLYRISDKYGGYGDFLWGLAEAFRPITAEEMAPIHPEAEEKLVVIDLVYQTLSCFEGKREVYFARISSGVKFDAEGNPIEDWATPQGKFSIWRKLVGLHMSGGTTGGGWDLAGIGWVSLFVGNGVAIHSTFWHNNYGVPMSRGCINCAPDDAKWVFRWTSPAVPQDPGDLTIAWPGGTKVLVKAGG